MRRRLQQSPWDKSKRLSILTFLRVSVTIFRVRVEPLGVQLVLGIYVRFLLMCQEISCSTGCRQRPNLKWRKLCFCSSFSVVHMNFFLAVSCNSLRSCEPLNQKGGLALEVHKIISGSKYTVIYGFYSDNRFLFRELMRAASLTAESERGGQPCGCWLWESNGFSVGLFNLSWVGSHLSARVVNSSVTFKCTGNHSVFIKAAQLKLWYLMQENYFSSFLFIWSEDSQRHW